MRIYVGFLDLASLMFKCFHLFISRGDRRYIFQNTAAHFSCSNFELTYKIKNRDAALPITFCLTWQLFGFC